MKFSNTPVPSHQVEETDGNIEVLLVYAFAAADALNRIGSAIFQPVGRSMYTCHR
jgi:hypothetical protein